MLNVRNEAGTPNQIDGALPEDLVGNMEVSTLGLSCLYAHGSLAAFADGARF